MMLVNESSGLYNNGSFGAITNMNEDSIYVKLDNNLEVRVERYEWKIHRYEVETVEGKATIIKKEAGSILQFPMKLAYAVTIHKSQGQTYERVNIDPYCWECGQLYTALSRVRSVGNMHFNYGVNTSYVITSLNVIAFYNKVVETANRPIDTSVKTLRGGQTKFSNNEELNSDALAILTKLRGSRAD